MPSWLDRLLGLAPDLRSAWADYLGLVGFLVAAATLAVASWNVSRTRAVEAMVLATRRRERLQPLVSRLRTMVADARGLGAVDLVALDEVMTKVEKALQLAVGEQASQSFAGEARRAMVEFQLLRTRLRSPGAEQLTPSTSLAGPLARVHDSLIRIETEMADDAERRDWRGQQP